VQPTFLIYIKPTGQKKKKKLKKQQKSTQKTVSAIVHICKYSKKQRTMYRLGYCGIVKIVASSETQYFCYL
jgi:hypothetical protein